MRSTGSAIQSFVIKIRLSEESALRWYGFITHVPSNNRKYFSNLDEIADIIRPYLEEMDSDRTEEDSELSNDNG